MLKVIEKKFNRNLNKLVEIKIKNNVIFVN